ncbi:NAD(P)H-dependent oxidoreductase [Shewanella avicenniae]|uniref:NAD(P)H-dependent oxidoreductase n=1 Tax=Shewanella avicenniae TaxID=2814294 RepID=A0ABX7QMU0_9GAMM|nr:NAD(P)H-dependent oxidoreductase [Shewanella avicenniae]QSX32218.1 NAD(P)H-dependent oxidoreductase [Shewanella avicenniae]
MNTLVVVSHPYPEQSKVIKAVAQYLATLENVEVRNLETLYGTDINAIDVAAEQQAYADKQRVVYLYPTHWFNITPMLKAYFNAVWSYGWAFGPGGDALKGKTLLAMTSAGANQHMYSAEGLIQSTMAEVMTPMKANALYVGMKYAEPLVLFDSMDVDAERLAAFKAQVAAALK